MNVENVISLKAVGDILPFRALKMTANGVDYAGAADKVIGWSLPGDLNRNYPSVQLHGRFIEATCGSATAIAVGDEIEQAANGKYIKKNAGTSVGVAITAGGNDGERFDAIMYA